MEKEKKTMIIDVGLSPADYQELAKLDTMPCEEIKEKYGDCGDGDIVFNKTFDLGEYILFLNVIYAVYTADYSTFAFRLGITTDDDNMIIYDEFYLDETDRFISDDGSFEFEITIYKSEDENIWILKK